MCIAHDIEIKKIDNNNNNNFLIDLIIKINKVRSLAILKYMTYTCATRV